MALVLGINCGFVTVAPTTDPFGFDSATLGYAYAFRVVAPVGAIKIIEIGWYCPQADNSSNTQVGLYSHDSGNDKPNTRLYTSGDFTTTSVGWLVKTGLDIAITGETTYWLAEQTDAAAGFTNIAQVGSAGQKTDRKTPQTSLTAPWGTSSDSFPILCSIYALIEVEGGGINPKVKASETFSTKKTLVKIGGTFVEKPVKVKVSGTFQ